jgi:uncharacterized RDD family membrane protein YckC
LFYYIIKKYHFNSNSLEAFCLDGFALTLLLSLYFAILESYKWQASFGKKIMELIVCDANGNRLGFWICFARAFVFQIIFWLEIILNIGSSKKELLHDSIFNHTKVIPKK